MSSMRCAGVAATGTPGTSEAARASAVRSTEMAGGSIPRGYRAQWCANPRASLGTRGSQIFAPGRHGARPDRPVRRPAPGVQGPLTTRMQTPPRRRAPGRARGEARAEVAGRGPIRGMSGTGMAAGFAGRPPDPIRISLCGGAERAPRRRRSRRRPPAPPPCRRTGRNARTCHRRGRPASGPAGFRSPHSNTAAR